VSRVCVRCGYLVLDGTRCRRDDGPSLPWYIVAKAGRLSTLRDLLHLKPAERVEVLHAARRRILAGART